MQPTESVLQQVARQLVGALLCGWSAGHMHRHTHSRCNHNTVTAMLPIALAYPDVSSSDFFPLYTNYFAG